MRRSRTRSCTGSVNRILREIQSLHLGRVGRSADGGRHFVRLMIQIARKPSPIDASCTKYRINSRPRLTKIELLYDVSHKPPAIALKRPSFVRNIIQNRIPCSILPADSIIVVDQALISVLSHKFCDGKLGAGTAGTLRPDRAGILKPRRIPRLCKQSGAVLRTEAELHSEGRARTRGFAGSLKLCCDRKPCGIPSVPHSEAVPAARSCAAFRSCDRIPKPRRSPKKPYFRGYMTTLTFACETALERDRHACETDGKNRRDRRSPAGIRFHLPECRSLQATAAPLRF